MTTLKQIFSAALLSGALLGFSSCKKDKDSTPPVAVAQRIQEYINDDEFIRFTYNPDSSVKKAVLKTELNTNGNIEEYSISYNAAKKIESIVTTAGETIVPVYDNNQLIRADFFEAGIRIGYTNYYFENGNLETATIYKGEGNNFDPFLEFNFAYNAQGNISETALFVADGEPGHMERSGHAEYQYDNKLNPLYEHNDLMILLWQNVSKNNIVLENHFDVQLKPEDRYTYTYNYKQNGLPEHAVIKKGLAGQPATTSSIDFIYKQ